MNGLYTYTVDLVKFHDYLESLVFVDGEYRPGLLRRHAAKVLKEASEQTETVLSDLFWFEEWKWGMEIEEPDLTEVDDGYLYLIALAPHLEYSHSLKRYSAEVGWAILYIAGWQAEQIRNLLGGSDQLEKPSFVTYINSVFSMFKDKMSLPSIEGWMSRETISHLHEAFLKVKPHFYEKRPGPSEALNFQIRNRFTDERVREAYQDILQMLEKGLVKGHELLMIVVDRG